MIYESLNLSYEFTFSHQANVRMTRVNLLHFQGYFGSDNFSDPQTWAEFISIFDIRFQIWFRGHD